MLYTVFMPVGKRVKDKGNAAGEFAEKLQVELRRGVLVLAVMSQLKEAQYGYSLRQALAEQGMVIEEGTLYPLLRRLEALGMLESEWRVNGGPPRRYYSLNSQGASFYQDLCGSWSSLFETVNKLIDGKGDSWSTHHGSFGNC
jgi:PadR family transcriptional regulator PadR